MDNPLEQTESKKKINKISNGGNRAVKAIIGVGGSSYEYIAIARKRQYTSGAAKVWKINPI